MFKNEREGDLGCGNSENYEIIRFMEHGNRWHPAMDCVSGRTFGMRWVRRCPEVEKGECSDGSDSLHSSWSAFIDAGAGSAIVM